MYTFETVETFLVVNKYAKKRLFTVPSNRVRPLWGERTASDLISNCVLLSHTKFDNKSKRFWDSKLIHQQKFIYFYTYYSASQEHLLYRGMI
jgi:hypothetical protein